MKKFFSFYGRTRRPAYWGVTLFLMLALFFVMTFMVTMLEMYTDRASSGGIDTKDVTITITIGKDGETSITTEDLSTLKTLARIAEQTWGYAWDYDFEVFLVKRPIVSLIMVLWIIFYTWTFLAITARRLRDAGLSPWLSLLSLIPYVSLVLWLLLGCLPSKK